MSALEAVQAARAKVNEAEALVRTEAKNAVREGLDVVFADPSVTGVAFAQKSSEYNDEGMYPGVFGPQLVDVTDDYDFEEAVHDYDGSGFYEMLYYGYGKQPPVPASLVPLKTALESIGDEVLSSLFGDESVVLVTKGADGYDFVSEYAGV